MKTKTILSKLNTSMRLIKKVKKDEKIILPESASKRFEELLGNYDAVVSLKKEIDTLRQDLRSKEKAIVKMTHKMSLSRKKAKKALKKASAVSKKVVLAKPAKKVKASRKIIKKAAP